MDRKTNQKVCHLRQLLDFYQKLERLAPFKINAIKTDNGLEFEGCFDSHLKEKNITHFFFNGKLIDYLIFFNSVRPHKSLDNLTPMGYLVFKGILSNMCVAHTGYCL